MKLPRHMLRTRWVRVERFPEGKKFGKHSMVIGTCWSRDGTPHSMRVAYVRDHPFLAHLNALPHVPRAVRAIYRKEVRLAHTMATTAWPILDAMDRAEAAWETYQAKVA